MSISVVKRETIQRVASPTAMLVGVAEPLATICSDALADGGLRVLRVGHIAAACERIPVVMPQVVVASTALHKTDQEMLTDRCVAVGADVITVAPDGEGDAALVKKLKDAANTALLKSLSRP